MTGTHVSEFSQEVIRLINLVAFDVCVLDEHTVLPHTNPLQVTLRCPLRDTIAPTLHPYLRNSIKITAKAHNLYAGKIGLERELTIRLYLEGLRAPAYVHGESPQDKPS
jgi:hypothetical protein